MAKSTGDTQHSQTSEQTSQQRLFAAEHALEVLGRIFEATGAASDTELARILDLKAQSVHGARKKKKIPVGWIETVSSKFNISAEWLVFGSGPESRRPTSVSEASAHPSGRQEDVFWVPKVRARLSAGHGSLETASEVKGYYAFRLDWLIRKGDPDEMRLLEITGDSMEPELQDKDTVLIDQSQTDIFPGLLYAVALDDEVLVKRIEKAPGCYLLRSSNQKYENITIDPTQVNAGLYYFRVIGQIIWIAREVR